jgi:hypothetical protein
LARGQDTIKGLIKRRRVRERSLHPPLGADPQRNRERRECLERDLKRKEREEFGYPCFLIPYLTSKQIENSLEHYLSLP